MSEIIKLSISFSGSNADDNEIDLYDVSQALVGFQRSLALTTHLVLNDQIITQAPSLKGAQILALPSEEGSWKMTAVIVVGAVSALHQLGTLPLTGYEFLAGDIARFLVRFFQHGGRKNLA
ncbi:MAG: hypothetical protein ACOYVJ_07725 [Nitrospirota bacterium]